MDDWNDFGAMTRPNPPPSYPSSSSFTSTTSSHHRAPLLQSSDSDSTPSFATPPSRTQRDDAAYLSTIPLLPARRHDDRLVDTDSVSLAESDSNAPEPASFMLRVNPDPDLDPDIDSSSTVDFKATLRKGDLDDVADDHELNIEGFRFNSVKGPASLASTTAEDQQPSVIASSLLRRVDRSYTKLEVISAKQIKHLLGFFNVFVVLSISYTLLTIILCNTVFHVSSSAPLPQDFLTDKQLAENLGALFVPDIISLRSSTSPNLSPSIPSRHHISNGMQQFYRDSLAAKGLFFTDNGMRSLPSPASLSVRQNGPLPPLPVDPVPPEVLKEPVPEGFTRAVLIPIDFSVARVEYRNTSHSMILISSLFVFFIGLLYGIRLARKGRRNVTHEQIWVLFLLVVTTLYLNTFESIIRLVEEISMSANDFFPVWVYKVEEVLTVTRDICFSGFCFFYLWASLHSYRILDPTKRLGFRSFYLPKLIVLLPYALFKALAFPILRLRLSEVPLLSAPAAAFIFSSFRVWNYLKAELLYAIATTVIELVLFGIIVYEAVQTMRVLERAPYMKYRTKRVGFRFFLYINFTFYIVFFVLQFLLLFGRQKGENISQLIIGISNIMFDIIWYYTAGPAMLVVGYVLVTAYVHLPHTSVGVFSGWFKSAELAPSGSRWSFSSEGSYSEQTSLSGLGSDKYNKKTAWANDEETPRSVVDNDEELQQQIVEPITYRKRESKDSLELKANCFTMQTHVIMFNFAWYVYYYGTPKLDNFRPKENPLPFQYTIAAHIKVVSTDTQVLVVDCSDRIIVTFKGSTSMRNLRTSLQMNHERLQSVVRTSVFGEDESGRLKKLFGRNYSTGKIHKGFAVAYMSVANEVMEQVRILRLKKKRPVFLTGHSLGGALATICSLDLWVKLDVSRREIFVSTFGSPRVGNSEFAEVYREVVPLHWRIVVDPDMVAKLPNVGYAHVGKKVVLTPHGEMIIDPNALEHRPWSGEAAGFAYHRKASYLLAMRAWCVRNHGMTYTPVFWPFPVRPEDKRRFAGAFDDDADPPTHRRMAAKIIRMDAMVDALGQTDTELSNMAVVEKWARLTRRILLNDKLRTN